MSRKDAVPVRVILEATVEKSASTRSPATWRTRRICCWGMGNLVSMNGDLRRHWKGEIFAHGWALGAKYY